MANPSARLRNRANQGGMIGMSTAFIGFGLIWVVVTVIRIIRDLPAGVTISYSVCAVIVLTAACLLLTSSRTYVVADPAAEDVIVANGFRTVRIPWSRIAGVEVDHGLRRRARLRLTGGGHVNMVALSSGLMISVVPRIAEGDRRVAACRTIEARLQERRGRTDSPDAEVRRSPPRADRRAATLPLGGGPS